jgi:hypothetical protein
VMERSIGVGEYPRNVLNAFTEGFADFPQVTRFPRVRPLGPIDERGKIYAIHYSSKLWRSNEPADTAEKIDYLRDQVEKASHASIRWKKHLVQAEWRSRAADREAARARRVAEKRAAELTAIRDSLWWRLHPGRLLGKRRLGGD